MATNNLRIVHVNRVSAINSAGFGGVQAEADKLLTDIKSSYGTTTTTAVTCTVTLPTSLASGAKLAVIAVLADSKVSGNTITTMTVTTNAGAGAIPGSSLVVTDTSAIDATSIGYGNGKYLAGYFTSGATIASGSTFTLTFPVSGVKITRIIIGEYWTPRYNIPYGPSVGYDDKSSTFRTQAGDLFTSNASRNKVLSFNTEYLDETDKFTLYRIINLCGKITPLFVSLFPAGSTSSEMEKEQMFSIYGKFTELSVITHTMYTMYSSSISIEEI